MQGGAPLQATAVCRRLRCSMACMCRGQDTATWIGHMLCVDSFPAPVVRGHHWDCLMLKLASMLRVSLTVASKQLYNDLK